MLFSLPSLSVSLSHASLCVKQAKTCYDTAHGRSQTHTNLSMLWVCVWCGVEKLQQINVCLQARVKMREMICPHRI